MSEKSWLTRDDLAAQRDQALARVAALEAENAALRAILAPLAAGRDADDPCDCDGPVCIAWRQLAALDGAR